MKEKIGAPKRGQFVLRAKLESEAEDSPYMFSENSELVLLYKGLVS